QAWMQGVVSGARLKPVEVAVGGRDVVTRKEVPEPIKVGPSVTVITRGGHPLETRRLRQTLATGGLDRVDVYFFPTIAVQIVLQGRPQGLGHAVQLLLVCLQEPQPRLDHRVIAFVLAALQLLLHKLVKGCRHSPYLLAPPSRAYQRWPCRAKAN